MQPLLQPGPEPAPAQWAGVVDAGGRMRACSKRLYWR